MTADAALLAAERRFRELRAEARAMDDDDDDRACNRLADKADAPLNVLIETSATTLAGAAAKMRAVLDPDNGTLTRELKCTEPILADVLKVVERLGKGTANPGTDPVVELGADFNAANLANQSALEREDDAQSNAAYEHLRDLEKRIRATRATSPAGAIIKLRVAQRFAEVDEDGDPTVGKMLASALADLDNLSGSAH